MKTLFNKLFGKLIGMLVNWRNSLPLIIGIGIFSTSTILNDGTGFFNSLWPAVVGIAVGTFNLIRAHAADHAKMIKDRTYPNHTAAWIARALFGVALVSIAHAYHFHLLKEFYLLLFCSAYFGIIFTIYINEYLDKELFYIAHGPNASKIDNLYYSISPTVGGFLQVLTYFLVGVFAVIQYLK